MSEIRFASPVLLGPAVIPTRTKQSNSDKEPDFSMGMVFVQRHGDKPKNTELLILI